MYAFSCYSMETGPVMHVCVCVLPAAHVCVCACVYLQHTCVCVYVQHVCVCVSYLQHTQELLCVGSLCLQQLVHHMSEEQQPACE